MAKEEVRVFGPATVSNVGPGFDLLGFALEAPGDELVLRRNHTGLLVLKDESGCSLPMDPEKNVAAVAASALLKEVDCSDGFDLIFTRKIPPGSGVGSSAASSVAAVVGLNELLGNPFETAALIPFALEGEKVSNGTIVADNIAPALLGGMILIRGYDPLDIKHIPYPADLWCAVTHPHLTINTLESRRLIPASIPLQTALKQCGNLAGLVAGLATNDYPLIRRSITDHLAEPHRKHQIPGFDELKNSSLEAGSIGTGLSGSGPSVFSLCRGEEMAQHMGLLMHDHFSVRGIASDIYISKISEVGCKML
jgi:homoserine kinase